MLVLGSLLILGAGLIFIAADRFVVLLAAATVGVISPSGYEVGPFLAIEQAALSQTVPDGQRTRPCSTTVAFATAAARWRRRYREAGAGGASRHSQATAWCWPDTPRLGAPVAVLAEPYGRLARSRNCPAHQGSRLGLHRS
jgi:hypothetical protein